MTVTADSYTDAAGNPGGAGTDTVTIDTLQPDGDGRHRRRFAERRRQQLASDLHLQRSADRLHAAPTLRRWAARLAACRRTDDPLVYTATFTADDGFDGTGSVTVTADSYTDAAGNPGGGGTDTVTIDTRSNPTVTVDIVDASLNDADNSSDVTFTFSEAPTDFTQRRHHGGGRHGERPDADWRSAGLHRDLHGRRRLRRHRLGDGDGRQVHRRGRQPRRRQAPTRSPSTRDEPDGDGRHRRPSLNDADNSSDVTFTFSEAPIGFTPRDITAVGGTV